MMKKYILMSGLLLLTTLAMAQPAAVKKAMESVLTLTTYSSDGAQRAVASGVFIDAKAVSYTHLTLPTN